MTSRVHRRRHGVNRRQAENWRNDENKLSLRPSGQTSWTLFQLIPAMVMGSCVYHIAHREP